MSLQVGQLTAQLALDKSQFDRGIKESEKKGSSLGQKLKKGMKVGTTAVVAMGTAAVAAASQLANHGDQIAKAAQKAGVSAGTYQELEYALGQAGVEQQTLNKLLERNTQRLGRAQAGNEKYADAYKDLGVAIKNSSGEMRGSEEVMDDVLESLASIENDSERAAKAGELLGTKSGRELAAALGNGIEGIDEARERAHELGIVLGDETLDASERFGDAWDDMKRSAMGFIHGGAAPVLEMLADRIMPFIVSNVIPVLRDFGTWLGPKMQAAAATLTAAFQQVGELLGPVITEVRFLWSAFREGESILDLLPGAIANVFGPETANIVAAFVDTFREILGAIQGVIETVVGWFRSGEDGATSSMGGIMEFAGEVWPQIVEIISGAVELIRAVVERVISAVQEFWDRFGEHILAFAERTWSRIQTLIQAALNIIQGVIETVLGLITGDWSRAWEGIKQLLGGVWDVIVTLISHQLDVIKTILGAAVAALSALWSAAWDRIKQVLSDAWEGIKSGVSNGVESVLEWFRGLPGRISTALSGLAVLLRTLAAEALSEMRNRVGRGIENVLDFFRNLPDTIKELVSGAGTWLFDAGKNIVQGLIDGIGDMVGAVGRKMDEVVTSVTDRLPWSPAKEGPLSDNPPEVGGANIVKQILAGVEDGDLGRGMDRQLRGLSAELTANLGGVVQVPAAVTSGAGGGDGASLGAPTVNVTVKGNLDNVSLAKVKTEIAGAFDLFAKRQ